jgi:hypothetical protein
MAMNITSVERALKKGFGDELKLQVNRESTEIRAVIGGFTNYRNPSGEDCLPILVMLNESGEYLEIQAPHVYNAADCKHKGSLFRVLLGTSLRTALVQFSFDDSDGEVRATVEIALMDGTCTPKQLRAAIEILLSVIDQYHPHVARAMETGEISYPDEEAIIRPTLEDSRSEDGPLGGIDIDAEIRTALEKTREAGKRVWQSTTPARDPGRHSS